MCTLPSVICIVAGSPPEPPCSVAQKGDKPAHRMTPNMISLDLKSHAGLFAELAGTLRGDSCVLQPCSSLCTLPVTAFACGDGGLSGASPSSVTIPCGDSLRRTGCSRILAAPRQRIHESPLEQPLPQETAFQCYTNCRIQQKPACFAFPNIH